MKWGFKHESSLFLVLCGVLALAMVSCAYTQDKPGGKKPSLPQNHSSAARGFAFPAVQTQAEGESETRQGSPISREALLSALDSTIALERSGVFTQGMGIRESILRENLDDFIGAVMAAYKELAWAYGMGIIDKAAVEQGMVNAFGLGGLPAEAARACLAFTQGNWAEAESLLRQFNPSEEIDSINQWMLLSCALEQESNDRQSADTYRAIHSRYAKFPEYWYRGARVFNGSFSAEYAEYCAALAPTGPFAAECRLIMAANAGLNPKDGQFLRARPEIDQLVSRSVSQGEPALLNDLMPLISLPDNSYTVYAVNLLRSLVSAPAFREYFNDTSAHASGRLSERLSYINRNGL